MPALKLRFAEKLDVIGVKGFAGIEVGKAARRPDLVTLENPRIALDGFHQRAGLACRSPLLCLFSQRWGGTPPTPASGLSGCASQWWRLASTSRGDTAG